MSDEIKRIYSGSDDYMLETANTLHLIFAANIAQFTAFDTKLDAPFSASWLNKIDLAGTVVRDSQIKDIQAQKTMEVLDVLTTSKTKYNEVKYFAKKAFPTNKAKQAEFGTDTYDDNRKSQSKMIAFMDEMHKACLKYQAELIVVGMTLGKITEIDTLRTQLLNANTNQEGYIKGRSVLTQDRIITLNECYLDTMTVIEAAQIVYINDYARKNQFVFNPTNTSIVDTEIVPLELIDLTPVSVFTIAYEPSRLYTLTNNGPGNVSFYISDNPVISTLELLLMPGDVNTLRADQLGLLGNTLFAKQMPSAFTFVNIIVEINLE